MSFHTVKVNSLLDMITNIKPKNVKMHHKYISHNLMRYFMSYDS